MTHDYRTLWSRSSLCRHLGCFILSFLEWFSWIGKWWTPHQRWVTCSAQLRTLRRLYCCFKVFTCKKRQNLVLVACKLDIFLRHLCTCAEAVWSAAGSFTQFPQGLLPSLVSLPSRDSFLPCRSQCVFQYNPVITYMSFCPYLGCELTAKRTEDGLQVPRLI